MKRLLFTLGAALLVLIPSACGLKGPPLPRVPTTPQQSLNSPHSEPTGTPEGKSK